MDQKIEAIIFDWIGTLYERGKGPFPWAASLLQYLRPSYKLGLVSIAKEGVEKRRQELEASGLMHFFDSIVVDVAKGDAQYLQCMTAMGTTPSTTAIVDDRTVRGIMVGNRLGCTTFWICKGAYAGETPSKETGMPTFTIESAKDLRQYL